jgi:hypothetical protein
MNFEVKLPQLTYSDYCCSKIQVPVFSKYYEFFVVQKKSCWLNNHIKAYRSSGLYWLNRKVFEIVYLNKGFWMVFKAATCRYWYYIYSTLSLPWVIVVCFLTCKKGLCYLFCIKFQYDACYMRDAMVNFC